MSEAKIEILRYNPDLKKIWDDFVESSKNGTFLFKRDYMEYHADRFEDYSLLFYLKGEPYCLLPANIKGDTIYSHGGLTYGGLVMNEKCTAEGIMVVFSLLLKFLRSQGIEGLIYKPVPYIYSSIPSQEDLYALFRNNASLIIRNISSSVIIDKRPALSTLRKRILKKTIKDNLIVRESKEINIFWSLLEENLRNRYKVKPVHSLLEIEDLIYHFPDNIKLFSAYKNNEMIGGVLCYFCKNVIHCQYISANEEGKRSGAIDAIFNYFLNGGFEQTYLDFGTSNEDEGRYLNESLIHQKEGFGGRAVCYDTYEINLC